MEPNGQRPAGQAPEAGRQLLEVASTLTRMSRVVAASHADGHWQVIDAVDRTGTAPVPGRMPDGLDALCAAVLARRQGLQCADARVQADTGTDADGDAALRAIARGIDVGSWLAVPLRVRDGSIVGVLCATDPDAREIGPQRVGILTRLADVYAAALDHADDRHVADAALADSQAQLERSRHALDASQQHLLDAESVARLREEFIAVMAHDLRNPLQSIRMAAEILDTAALPARQQRLVTHLHESVVRMSELIEVTMDFARGRLGGGLSLTCSDVTDLQQRLQQIVDEVRQAYPGRVIHASLDVPASLHCDPHRIGQLLSNLLVNAAVHGRADSQIQVIAGHADGRFALSVANQGDIAPAAIARIFEPFDRQEKRADEPGLGLGLYIASQIATAHGGTLKVFSTAAAGTLFEFSMPVAAGTA